MRILFCFILVMSVGGTLWSHPRTDSVVVRPQTNPTRTLPRTNSVVVRPQTTSVVVHPSTQPSVAGQEAKKTSFSSFKTAAPSSANKASGGSYTPSYKQAKPLGQKKEDSTATLPPAAQNALATLGLGGGADAAEKANAAANFDITKGMTEEQAQKIGLPKDFMGKLKQRSHEEAKSRGKK